MGLPDAAGYLGAAPNAAAPNGFPSCARWGLLPAYREPVLPDFLYSKSDSYPLDFSKAHIIIAPVVDLTLLGAVR